MTWNTFSMPVVTIITNSKSQNIYERIFIFINSRIFSMSKINLSEKNFLITADLERGIQ